MEGKNNNLIFEIPYSHFLDIWRGIHRDNPNYKHYYNSRNDVVRITNTRILGQAQYLHNENLPQLTLISCDIESITVSSSNVKAIIIQDTNIKEKIIIRQNSRVHEIAVSNNSKVHGIQIDTSELCILSTSNSTVNQINNVSQSKIEHLTIDNSQIKYLTSGQKSIFINIHVTFSTISHFSLVNSYIDSLQIWQKCKIDTLNLSDRMAINTVLIDRQIDIVNFTLNSSIVYDLKLSNSSFESIHFSEVKLFKVKIENLIKLNSLICSDSSYLEHLSITTQRLTSAIFKQTTFYILDIIDSQLSKDSFLSISNSQINKLQISNSLFGGTFMLNNISSINKLNRFNEYPQGPFVMDFKEFEFSAVNEKSLLRIAESDLGRAQFIGCDFRTFNRFEFKNSKILEVFVAGTELPIGGYISYPKAPHKYNTSVPNKIEQDNSETIEKYLKSIGNEILEQQRLALSQFKKIYENRGDSVRATQALAEEMEVYRQQLKNMSITFDWPSWYKVWIWHHAITKNKQWWNNRGERVNLWLNKFSNFYGNNWLRGVITTISINSLLFWAYSYSLNFRLGTNWEMFRYLIAYSFEFLNPLRKADFLTDKFTDYDITIKASPASIAIDYISRIIIAYFVYQTIAAFRKFGKKSG